MLGRAEGDGIGELLHTLCPDQRRPIVDIELA